MGPSINGAAYDEFSFVVRLSEDGKTIAVGAPIGGYVNMYWWDEATANYIRSASRSHVRLVAISDSLWLSLEMERPWSLELLAVALIQGK